MCKGCDWEDWRNTIQEAMSEIDLLPPRAEHFAVSVDEKLENILIWVEENKHITEPQKRAVENMYEGIKRWQG